MHWLGRFAVRRQAMIRIFRPAALCGAVAAGRPRADRRGMGQGVVGAASALCLDRSVFFAVSARAAQDLVQRWFAADPRTGDPYFLYTASNLGSFAGLISYPALVEPLLPLEKQSIGWTLGYVLLFILVAAATAARWGRGPENANRRTRPATKPGRTGGDSSDWLLIAAVPSGLMLSTTTHLTTNIVAMPLLWVLPLGLYLLSFVIAFSSWTSLTNVIVTIAPALLLLVGGQALLGTGGGTMLVALASLVMLFVVATALTAIFISCGRDRGI